MADDPQRLERNKQHAIAFLTRAFSEHDPKDAAERYMASTYIQHHPGIADGREAFVEYVSSVIAQFPQMSIEFKRAIAEGDLVVLHGRITREPGQRGTALAEIFRFDDEGKIVEHWDVAQPIPETETRNSGML
jgi:predicted SnoaL-like aldol condensation-catalyzing enzyme